MTTTVSVSELLELSVGDLRDLIAAAPGDDFPTRLAWLGFDLASPEHRAALIDRGILFPSSEDEFSQVAGGVRSDLTPTGRPTPTPDDDQGTAPDAPENGSEPIGAGMDIVELLAHFRGRHEPFLAGTFAMYSAANGDVVIVTEIPGRGIEQNTIPAKIVRLGIGAMSGKGGMLGRMIGL